MTCSIFQSIFLVMYLVSSQLNPLESRMSLITPYHDLQSFD